MAAGITPPIAERCRVLDTLGMARRMHPGQRNNLDALCKRYNVDNSTRDAVQPSVNGSRVAPVSSIQTVLSSVYSSIAASPFSRPIPEAPKPPNGAIGPTAR